MVTIEGKLANLQVTQQKLQVDNLRPITEQFVEETKYVAAQCTTEAIIIQVELGGLHTNISAPAE